MSDIDRLMAEDPLLLSTQDIDKIIAYQRAARAKWESGVKPSKLDVPKVDLTAVMQVLAPQPEKPQLRRI